MWQALVGISFPVGERGVGEGQVVAPHLLWTGIALLAILVIVSVLSSSRNRNGQPGR